MNINCKHCEELIDLTGQDFAEVVCHNCKTSITQVDIAKALESPFADHEIHQGDDSYKRGHCCTCDMLDVVVKTEDAVLICSNCGEQYEEYQNCALCGHNNTGDVPESSIFGCPACEEEVQSRLNKE